MLRNSFSGRSRRPATSQQRSGGLYFLALNQYFIRDKTIPAGQNADFGGFLRAKAGLPDVFWFGARSLVFSSVAPQWHVCRRKVRCHSSFPAELGPLESRSQGLGRPCLSIGTRATGSLLHGDLMLQINGVNKGAFLHRLFHFIQLV